LTKPYTKIVAFMTVVVVVAVVVKVVIALLIIKIIINVVLIKRGLIIPSPISLFAKAIVSTIAIKSSSLITI